MLLACHDRRAFSKPIHYGKVSYLQDPSHPAETENEFAIALGLSPNNAYAWKNLIQFRHLVKQPKEAELLCSQAQSTAVAAMLTEVCTPR